MAALPVLAALLFWLCAHGPAAAFTPMIAMGDQHSCALTISGGVKCWGGNWAGELGNGTRIEQYAPVDVIGLSGATAITAGYGHTCALTDAGGVKCWGSNFDGELGNNGAPMHFLPVDVVGLSSGVRSVAAGGTHTCAVMLAGGVKCWGRNDHGQLGNGGTVTSPVPVDVVGLGGAATAVATGGLRSCALISGGALKCWGANDRGQLGNGNTVESHLPVAVSGLATGVAAVSVNGWHTCALTVASGIKCWGGNDVGQLGDNTTTDRSTPVNVSGLGSGVAAVTAGAWHSCALLMGGTLKCWGDNYYWQLGNGSTTGSTVPVDVIGLDAVATAIAAGSAHTCVLTSSGGVKCWGMNYPGQLGNGSSLRTTPTNVSDLATGFVDVTAGIIHSCARAASGTLKCWGGNYWGALGDGTGEDQPTPVDVAALPLGATTASAGTWHTCAVSGGGAKCWGRNTYGQLGDDSKVDRWLPTDVSGLSVDIAVVAAGAKHSCALTIAGGVKCWGFGVALGGATYLEQLTPLDIAGLGETVTAIAAGGFHNCVITGMGGVKCWGDNTGGQLGDGTKLQRTAPVDVVGLSGVTAISAGEAHTCALTGAGGVKCWGYNFSSQLGDGSVTDRWSPVDVHGLSSGVVSLAAGGTHTCARLVGGGLKCWGGNSIGQLGDATTIDHPTPVDVVGLGSPAIAIAAGYQHTCAIVAGGAVQCWGDARAGQLGVAGLDLHGPSSFVVNLNVLGLPVLGSSPDPSIITQSVTFTAAVGGTAPGGTVDFRDDAASIPGCGAAAVVAGIAQCATSSLAVGTHAITAAYSGDAGHPGATSDPRMQRVVFALDVDDNGAVDALTDGLLAVRHLFGLSGDALTNGAIGPGAGRTKAANIAAFIGQAGLVLDIDGDGHVNPLTDGVLILRYLFGLRGDALIRGAVTNPSPRDTTDAIETYLRAVSGN